MICAPLRIRRCSAARIAVRLRLHLLLSGICFGLALGAATTPTAAIATEPDQFAAHPYAPHVAEASHRFGIPELWIWAVMRAESRGNSRAVSPAGAIGLMQIMPGTWSMLSARHGLGSDPFDVRANILGGAAYLRAMWDRYRDVSLMLAAYNAGPGRADDYAAGRRSLPAETVNYVAQIAPSLGMASVASPAAMSPSSANPWRQAALFTQRGDGEAVSNNDAVDTHPQRTQLASPSASLPSPNSTPHPLFVSLSQRNP
jgi:soluble lytic murein transglycosylase-like protein